MVDPTNFTSLQTTSEGCAGDRGIGDRSRLLIVTAQPPRTEWK